MAPSILPKRQIKVMEEEEEFEMWNLNQHSAGFFALLYN